MKTAKLFNNGRSQAVRLPKECRFTGDSVYVRKLGNIVILVPKDAPWTSLIESLDAQGRRQTSPASLLIPGTIDDGHVYDDDGRMVNARFGPYKIYRSDEMPRIEAYLVQTMEKTGPFGAKAIAEIPKDGVVPAIRNAIANATGVRINDTPFTPERVWAALRSG